MGGQWAVAADISSSEPLALSLATLRRVEFAVPVRLFDFVLACAVG